MDIPSLVTARFVLDRVEEAFRAAAAARTGLKVMVEPGAREGGVTTTSMHDTAGIWFFTASHSRCVVARVCQAVIRPPTSRLCP